VRVATRLLLHGCALAVALALSGCGGSGGESHQTSQTRPSDPAAAAKTTASGPAAKSCQGQVGGFIGSMDALRRRLAVGVSYDQYVNEVEGVRASYRRIPVAQLRFACLQVAAAPGEQGFDQYIEAANEWGRCVGEAGCDAATVEPVLQRRWRIASHFVTEAHQGLQGLGAD
jgi:hypothetical protein